MNFMCVVAMNAWMARTLSLTVVVTADFSRPDVVNAFSDAFA